MRISRPPTSRDQFSAGVHSRRTNPLWGAMMDPTTSAGFPQVIDAYELLLPLGTGGMATVFLARHHIGAGLHREVALKLIHPQLRLEGGAQLFQREAKLASRIRHPNVVPVTAVSEGVGHVYLVMEYVEGDSLSGVCNATTATGGLPVRIAARILVDALSGLHAAHELRDEDGRPLHLVHRDFSPQNVLIGTDGVTRLSDFGIAKITDSDNSTATGLVKGKVGYMAPEQIVGCKLDRRVDVWAAGVIAWELLAGRRLRRKTTPAEAISSLLRTPPPALSAVRKGIPAEVAATVQEALTLSRDERCATAAEFRERLTGAFRLTGGIADVDEVSEFVSKLTKERLQLRQERVASILALRRQISKVSQRAFNEVYQEQRSPTQLPEATRELLTAPASERPTPRPVVAPVHTAAAVKRSKGVGLAVFSIGLAVLGFVVLVFTSRQGPANELALAYYSALERSAGLRAPQGEPKDVPSLQTVRVSANRIIAAVRLDGQSLRIPSRTRRLVVRIAPVAPGVRRRLEIESASGLKRAVSVSNTAEEVRVRFGGTERRPRRFKSAPAAPAVPQSSPQRHSKPLTGSRSGTPGEQVAQSPTLAPADYLDTP